MSNLSTMDGTESGKNHNHLLRFHHLFCGQFSGHFRHVLVPSRRCYGALTIRTPANQVDSSVPTSGRMHLWKQQPARRHVRRGVEQTPITSLRHTVATTRVCTTGSQTLTKTTTATTPRTKATASSTPFPPTGHRRNDTDADGYGDNPAPANEPDACPTTPGASTKTASAVPTPTVTAGRRRRLGPTQSRPEGGCRRGRVRRQLPV